MLPGIKWGVVGSYFKMPMLWILIAVLVSTNSCSYIVGKSHEKTAQAQKAEVVAKKQTQAIIKEVEYRAPLIVKKERATVESNNRVDQAAKELNDAVYYKESNPECVLAPGELKSYRVLSDEINAAAGRSNLQ